MQILTKKFLTKKRTLLILASAGLVFAAQCHAEDSINSLLLRSHAALANGQAQQAAEGYEKVAAMGESAEAEIGLVRAYLQAGEFRKAIAFGNLVAAEHPDVSETAALLAYLEDREGQTTPALAKLAEELKKHPDDIALLAAQTEILIDRLAIAQAIQQLDDWIGRNPPQSDIYRLRARAALAAGNREEWVSWRRKATLAYESSAYESSGKFESAKPVSDNNETPKVSRWPAPYLEPFPLGSKNAIKSGNGFVVDQGRHVITHASLVSVASVEVWVRNGLGKIRKAKVETFLPDQGLALLRLDTPYAKEWSLPELALAVPDDVKFCFVLGFPLTDPLESSYPIIAPGVVVRPDAGINNLMQITGSLGTENSGSAVFDSSGQFIGMTLGKQEPLKGITDREAMLGKGTFAVRAEGLQKLLAKSGRQAKKFAKTKAVKVTQSVEDLYEKLLPAVVTIVVTD